MNMKKNFFAFSLLLLANASCTEELPFTQEENNDMSIVQGDTVTLLAARNILLDMMSGMHDAVTRSEHSSMISSSFSTPLIYTASEGIQKEVDIHVINFGDNDGYAIMTSDQRLPPLLALTSSGHLSENDQSSSPELSDLLMELLLPIPIMKDSLDDIIPNEDGTITWYGKWSSTYYHCNSAGTGMCPVKWGQDTPYNYYCPTDGSDKSVAGCGPVALGQLLSIYEKPQNYGGHTYNWSDMKHFQNLLSQADQGADDVERLLVALGQPENLDVEYHSNANGGSKNSENNIVRTLENMGLSSGGVLQAYNKAPVVSELAAGYPVIMMGETHRKKVNEYFLGIIKTGSHYVYRGGHIWLADGLMVNTRPIKIFTSDKKLKEERTQSYVCVLCNWGQKGLNDGFFVTGNFNSSHKYQQDGTNGWEGTEGYYTYNLKAVTGIRP